MAERIAEYETRVRGADGAEYRVSAWGAPRSDGTWIGWLTFEPLGSPGPPRHTERETTQPTRQALAYWAEGLEPVYFEGALARAHAAVPPQ
jgi:hypothetical protein